MNVLAYAKGVEKLVDPVMVGKAHYMQTKLAKMPVWLQKKIVVSSAKKADKMPFVVEPYCSFLFYEIPVPERVQKFMPEGFVPANRQFLRVTRKNTTELCQCFGFIRVCFGVRGQNIT